MSTPTARDELESKGVPYTEDEFLRCIRSGRTELAKLFILAGMSPDTVRDGETALAAAANNGHTEVVRILLTAGADPSVLVDALHARNAGKDYWDKLTSLSGIFTFVSSLLIAAVGWYFTDSYNRRQLELATNQATRDQQIKADQNRLTELQIVEKMIPHLVKDEQSKQAALLAISVLASPTIASRMAELYGGQGSVKALTQIASADARKPAPAAVSALTGIAARKESDAMPAQEALAAVLAGKEKAIVSVSANNQAFCNGFVADARDGWVVTTAYCLDAAKPVNALSIRTSAGKDLPVKSTKISEDGFVALIQVDAQGLSELSLSQHVPVAGEIIMRLAFDLSASRGGAGGPSVAIGRVLRVGRALLFTSATGKMIEGPAISLEIPHESKVAGSGGGPILDREGNVACMTYQGDDKGRHECLPASVIANALATARRS